MLILHVIVDLTPGGAELMLKRLIAVHAGNPHYRHHVVSLRGKGSVGPMIEALGVTVETLGMRGPLSLPGALMKLVRRTRALKPDIVQGWMYHGDFLGGIAARIAGLRRILWSVRATHIPSGVGTSALTSRLRLACARLSHRVPSRIIYVADAARVAHEALGYDPAKSIVIPNGYEVPEDGADEAARAALRRRLGLGADAMLIGTAGRYNALKDYPTFIAAAARLAPHHADVRFLMIGRGLERGNAELLAAVEATGYAERFHLLGEQTGLNDWLAGLDIFCLHSISEGFPNVVAEAMALAVPCVVTDVGDAAALVGDTGIVVPPGDPEALADAWSRLIAAGGEARSRLGLGARQMVIDKYSMTAIAGRYEGLYWELVEAGAASPADPALPQGCRR